MPRKKNYPRPKPEPLERAYPFLTLNEEQIYKDTTVLTVKRKENELKTKLEELTKDVWAGKSITTFDDDVFYEYHPEAKMLISDPTGIKDPDDLVEELKFAFDVSPRTFHPRTNQERYNDLVNNWRRIERQTCPEYQYWDELNEKIHAIRKESGKLALAIKDHEEVSALIQREPLQLPDTVCDVIDKLLKPLNKKDKDNDDEDEESTIQKRLGIKALLIPYSPDGVKWQSTNITRNAYEFRPFEVFRLCEGKSNYNKLIAVIYQNKIHFRVTEHQNFIMESLTCLAEDPEEFFNTFGKKLGECLLCGKTLTREDSLDLGYGKTCAKYVGLIKTKKKNKKDQDKKVKS